LSVTGVVFNIQRFSIHDGPGIRTTVFLKGCPLHCFWCHNPEGIRPEPEIQFFPSRCIGCGECLKVCPEGAHELRDGVHIFHRERCVACGQCAALCYAGALEMIGQRMTVDEVLEEVLRDRAFYATSGGGVTLSGGEPLLQREFTLAILERSKAEGLHTAIETAANCRWDHLAELLPVTDLIMMDIKHMDADKHRAATGVSNGRILDNARRLAQTDKPIIFRVPVVPTVNDEPEQVAAIARFVRSLVEARSDDGRCAAADISLELLPFHRLATDKYRSLDMEYRAHGLETPTREHMAELVEVARAHSVTVRGWHS